MEGALKLWAVIVAVGALNYLSRLSFIALFARRSMPPLLARALKYVPAAMLTALILPMVVDWKGAATDFTTPRVYAALIALLSLSGAGVATRHIWIQNLPKDQIPACGPGLDYMLETMPMADVLKELMHGSGECAAKGWTFLTLGIPEWSLLCYLALGALAMLIAVRKKSDSIPRVP